MSRSHTGGPRRSPGGKGLERPCPAVHGGEGGPESKATPEDNQGRRRLCLQRSCPTLTPRKGQDTKPRSLPMGHLGRRFPGLTASLSHVLPTVGDDHLLLGLPVLAALGLCGPKRRGGIRAGRVESKGGSGIPDPLPIPPPPPNSSFLWSLSLGPRFSSPTFTAVPQGPRQPPTSICRKTSRPSVISPNTTCLPSSQSVLSHVRKNWEPLVFGPELAMESRPGGEKCPSAPLTLLVVLGMEGGVQMLPCTCRWEGKWDEDQELTMRRVEKTGFRGPVSLEVRLEGDRENQRQGA